MRHGESQAQVDDLIAGHTTCRGLSALGRRQAEALRDRLAATSEL
ncbi:MAG: histidine phosphatase family protein, partial [Actinomycetota bacterium]